MIDFNTPIDMGKLSAGLPECDDSPFDFDEPVKTKKQVTPSNLQPRPGRGRPKKEEVGVVVYTPKASKRSNYKPGDARGKESLSDDDKAYITDNAGRYSAQDIANNLSKRYSTVFSYMQKHNLLSESDRRDIGLKKRILNELHDQPFWTSTIVKGYSEDEIKYFEEEWCSFVEQLDGNVTATERLQLRQLIENQIQIDRLTINEHRINSEVAHLDEEIQTLQDQVYKLSDDDEIERLHIEIRTLMNNQGALQTSKTAVGRDRDNLQKAQNKLIDQLDVSRAKRVERYSVSDRTWAKMLMEIKENPRLKKQMNAVAYISFLATERMRGKLTRNYTYADGSEHPPMLLPEGMMNQELTQLVETLYVPQEV